MRTQGEARDPKGAFALPCWHPILRVPASGTVRTKPPWFTSHAVRGAVSRQPKVNRTDCNSGAGSSHRETGREEPESSWKWSQCHRKQHWKGCSETKTVPRTPLSPGAPRPTLRPCSLWSQTCPLQVLLAPKNPLWEGNRIYFLFSSYTHANTWHSCQNGRSRPQMGRSKERGKTEAPETAKVSSGSPSRLMVRRLWDWGGWKQAKRWVQNNADPPLTSKKGWHIVPNSHGNHDFRCT